MSINRVNISGHLTRDPELRMTPKGTQVLSFGIAVNDRRLNRETNQWEDYPNFVECTMFGTRAEAVGRIVRKGMKVSIDGKLRLLLKSRKFLSPHVTIYMRFAIP